MADNLTKSELNDIDLESAVLFESMNEFVSKMSTRRDFFDLIDMIVSQLGEFRKTHSEYATQRLAENICEFSVYYVADDAEWRAEIQDDFVNLPNSDDISKEELEVLTKNLNSPYQLEYGVPRPKSTYLRLVDSNTANPILEVRVW